MENAEVKPKRRRLRLRILLVLALGGLVVGGYYFVTRYVLSNFAVVIPGKVYRSGQPRVPEQLEGWVKEYGIKTIIDLRGDNLPVYKAERELATRLKIDLIPVALSSQRGASKERLAELIHALETAKPPMLLHCQYGIDRSGFASMLTVMYMGQSDYKTARGQLRRPLYGKHISDTIVMYEQYCVTNKLDPNSWPQFKKWATTVYDPGITANQSSQPAE